MAMDFTPFDAAAICRQVGRARRIRGEMEREGVRDEPSPEIAAIEELAGHPHILAAALASISPGSMEVAMRRYVERWPTGSKLEEADDSARLLYDWNCAYLVAVAAAQKRNVLPPEAKILLAEVERTLAVMAETALSLPSAFRAAFLWMLEFVGEDAVGPRHLASRLVDLLKRFPNTDSSER